MFQRLKLWKKLFKAASLKSMDVGLQQGNALYDKEIKSADLPFVADSERILLRGEVVLMHF